MAAAPIALADNDDDDLVNEKLQPLDEGDEGIQPLGNNGTWDNPKLVVSPCEGSTEFDYSADMSYNGSLPTGVNLLGLWGERYEAYVRGESVPLYGFDGKGLVADPPLCVVREVDGDPQSEWSYCTDRASGVCGSYDLDGDIVDADPSTKPPTVSGDVGGQIDLEDGNPRLDEDQQQALMFLLANEVAIPDSAWDWFGGDYYDWKSSVASNDNSASRQARQFLAWCITDPGSEWGLFDEDSGQYVNSFCETAMPKSLQAEFTAAVGNANAATLSVDAEPAEAYVDRLVDVTVQTSLVNVALQLTLSEGATLSVPDASLGKATIVDGKLFLRTSEAVTLTLTSDRDGVATVEAAGDKQQMDELVWAQSAGTPFLAAAVRPRSARCSATLKAWPRSTSVMMQAQDSRRSPNLSQNQNRGPSQNQSLSRAKDRTRRKPRASWQRPGLMVCRCSTPRLR